MHIGPVNHRMRPKTAKLEFPPLISSDNQNPVDQELFSLSPEGLSSSQNSNSVFPQQRGYSTLPIPLAKGRYRIGTATATATTSVTFGQSTSMSTLFPYPPIPPQNPKLKLLKSSAGAGLVSGLLNPNLNKSKYSSSSLAIGKSKESTTSKNDNNAVRSTIQKATITIPILPLKPKTSKKNGVKVTRRIDASDVMTSGEIAEGSPTIVLSPLIGAKLNEHGTKEKPGGSANGDRLRVRRSDKERATNPDCIRLDNLGLKQFPIIGSEEIHLRVLSLQHNSISRLDSLSPLTHLLVLDLYDNRVERITGLHGLPSLKVLLLGKNRIRRIEGLDALKRLEILDLHGNQLRYVDNLAALSSLRVLNLAGNLIRTIRNLGPYGLSSLMELNLKRNRIKNLEGLQKAPHIKKLFLANNDIQSFSALHLLRKLNFLQELLLDSNPLCSLPDYTSQVLTIFPCLETLDRVQILEPMKLEAKAWHKRRLAAEEERRKEIEKLNTTLASSRDEVIFEAKRRWESLKHFVRTNNGDQEQKVTQKSAKSTRSRSVVEHFDRGKMVEKIPQDPVPNEINPTEADNQIEAAEDLEVFDDTAEQCNFPDIANNSDATDTTSTNDDFPVFEAYPVVNNLSHEINFEIIETSDALRISEVPEFVPDEAEDESQSVNILPVQVLEESKPPVVDLPQIPRPHIKSTKVAVVRPLLRSAKTLEYLPPDAGAFTSSEPRFSASIPTPSIQDSILSSKVTEIPDKVDTPEQEQQTLHTLRTVQFDEDESDEQNFQNPENTIFNPTYEEIGDRETQDILGSIPHKLDQLALELPRSKTPNPMLRRSKSTFHLPDIFDEVDEGTIEHLDHLLASEKKCGKPDLRKWRSSSVDVHVQSGDSDTSDVESVATSTNASDISSRKPSRRQIPRARLRVKTARQSSVNSSTTIARRPSTCQKERGSNAGMPFGSNKSLRRTDSGLNLDTIAPPVLKRQGADYLVEIDGKILSIYGQGALKHTLHGFSPSITAVVTTVNFHFISFDGMIPCFGKLKQFYPALDNFHFRSNNICTLGQLNSLADLQGITSLEISSEGNPVVENPFWKEYVVYRLAHWGLQYVNGKEVASEYRGNGRINPDLDYKMFDSLGYLALSCLPQTALKPLAKRLHTLHCFCCCSPSSSSDESGKKKSDPTPENNGSLCNAWDDDPVLLDVIGKEALVYSQPPESGRTKDSQDIALRIMNDGQVILEKLEMLEKVWPGVMCEAIEDILTDYMFMDNYMKKGLKAISDAVLANEKFK